MSSSLVLQRQYQALAAQNQVLRIKAKKINQIQTYVNILMQSSQNCQQQIRRSNIQNRQLKNRIDNLMGQNVKLQQTYDTQFKSLQNQYKRQLLKKQEDIRYLENNKEKQTYMYEQALNQSQNRSRNDVQRLKLQILHIEGEYEAQIKKLTNLLNERFRQLQSTEQSKNQMKKAYNQQLKQLSFELNKFQKGYQQSENENFLLKEELMRIRKLSEQLQSSQNMLKKQLTRRQEQFINDKRNNEKKLRSVQQSLMQVNSKQKKTQHKLQQCIQQLQRVKRDNVKLFQQGSQLKNHSKKVQRLILQRQNEIKHHILKNQQDQDQFKRIIKRHSQQLQRSEQQLSLANQRFLCQKRNCDSMKSQIEELIRVIDKLQIKMSQNQHQSSMLNKENQVLFKEVDNLGKQLTEQGKQLDEFQASYKKARENSLMFQQLYNKQSLKAKSLQSENNQIWTKLQSLSRQQKILQEQQIQQIVQKHLCQKRQMLENNRTEKQVIIAKYQLALKQKDQQAKKRLQLLEDQINLMRFRH